MATSDNDDIVGSEGDCVRNEAGRDVQGEVGGRKRKNETHCESLATVASPRVLLRDREIPIR